MGRWLSLAKSKDVKEHTADNQYINSETVGSWVQIPPGPSNYLSESLNLEDIYQIASLMIK